MKNFSDQFRKTVNDMKPDKSEIRHSVLNGGTNRKTVHVHQGFGQKFGTLLTASLSFLLVLGIIVGGGLLRGMKKPLSPGGSNYGHDSNVLEDPSFRTDTETTLVHYGPPDISADSETEPPSSGTEYPDITYETVTEPIEICPTDTTETVDPSDTQPDVPTDPEIPVDSQPVDPPHNDPDIVFSYDPIDDFGVDALSEVAISTDGLDLKISNNQLSRWWNFNSFDAVYTVGGIEKNGRMFVALGDPLEFEGTDIHVPSIYLVLYDPDSGTVVAAKKWYMAGAVFINSDIPGTFLLFGASYDTSNTVNGYFGVYRVTDSVTGKADFVLDHDYDSCKIQRTFFNSRAKNSLTADELVVIAADKKYNDNYYQRLRKLVADKRFGQILDIYGGYSCMAGECFSDPKYRRDLSDAEFEVFSDITQLAEYNGK